MSKSCSASAAWKADHTTIRRWVQRYGPELEERLRRHLKPTNKLSPGVSMRPTFVSRAVGTTSTEPSIPPEPRSTSCYSGLRDGAAAKRLFRKALTDPWHPQPRVINTDQAHFNGAAISRVKEGRNPAAPLPPPACPILEQHRGAGSSSDQTTSEGQAGLW